MLIERLLVDQAKGLVEPMPERDCQALQLVARMKLLGKPFWCGFSATPRFWFLCRGDVIGAEFRLLAIEP
jgi:hypothetical protein